MATKPFNLMQWIADHDHEFQEPVMNKQFYKEADDVIVFVSKGPNTRNDCLLYTSPSPRDKRQSRMPSSA